MLADFYKVKAPLLTGPFCLCRWVFCKACMGLSYSGAIIAGGKGTAEGKFKALENAGVKTTKSLAEIGKALREVTGW